MTDRVFKMMLNRIPVGEYNTNDLFSLYLIICTDKQKDTSKYKNNMRFWEFVHIFEECKYGLEYWKFKNTKMHYIGTNDLHTLIVEEK